MPGGPDSKAALCPAPSSLLRPTEFNTDSIQQYCQHNPVIANAFIALKCKDTYTGSAFFSTGQTKLNLKGSVKEPNKFHNNETEKITRKASDTAE